MVVVPAERPLMDQPVKLAIAISLLVQVPEASAGVGMSAWLSPSQTVRAPAIDAGCAETDTVCVELHPPGNE